MSTANKIGLSTLVLFALLWGCALVTNVAAAAISGGFIGFLEHLSGCLTTSALIVLPIGMVVYFVVDITKRT